MNIIGRRVDEIPPTMNPGTRAIDHVWATPGDNFRIDKRGLIPHDHASLSNYAGLLVDIVVREEIPKLAEPRRNPRGLKSGNAKNVRRYTEYVTEKITKRHISKSLDKLEAQQGLRNGETNIKKKINNIDKHLQEILIKGEHILGRK